MIDYFKRVFRRSTPLEIATRELADAELSKLQAQTAQEWASSIVSYNSTRIARLKAYIATQTKESEVTK